MEKIDCKGLYAFKDGKIISANKIIVCSGIFEIPDNSRIVIFFWILASFTNLAISPY